MKTEKKERLLFRKVDRKTGKIIGIHQWATGFQLLEFNDKAHFDRFAARLP